MPGNVGVPVSTIASPGKEYVTFIMQISRVESVESHLLALTKFSVADFAKCSLNLIEEVRLLLQSVTVPSSASPPRPQDEEGLAP